MTAISFTRTVPVFVGLGFPYEVSSVLEAYQFIVEWAGSRSPAYAATLAICQSALVGDNDVESARVAFEAFARSRGILAPEAIELAAARAADEWMTA